MRLVKKVIRSKPPAPTRKINKINKTVDIMTAYIDKLKEADIQPKFVLRHADTFRSLFFDYYNKKFVMKEDLHGETKRLEEQTKELISEVKRLTGRIEKLEKQLEDKDKDEDESAEESEEEPVVSKPKATRVHR